jgi:hypothetical protein
VLREHPGRLAIYGWATSAVIAVAAVAALVSVGYARDFVPIGLALTTTAPGTATAPPAAASEPGIVGSARVAGDARAAHLAELTGASDSPADGMRSHLRRQGRAVWSRISRPT